MKLKRGQIEEAVGRAALIYELETVEDRLDRACSTIEEAPEDLDVDPMIVEREMLTKRLGELLRLLWGPDDPEEGGGWRVRIENLPREEALLVVEALLAKHGEITPLEDADSKPLHEIVEWLLEKIEALPEEERDAWTR